MNDPVTFKGYVRNNQGTMDKIMDQREVSFIGYARYGWSRMVEESAAWQRMREGGASVLAIATVMDTFASAAGFFFLQLQLFTSLSGIAQ